MEQQFNIYVDERVHQARIDILEAGYEELKTSKEVQEAFARKGTTLVMINSVCGCAGSIARPAAEHSIHYDRRPDYLVTVFDGQDREATAMARTYFGDYPPSSPSFALLKDGEICTMIERHDVEASNPVTLIEKLQQAFDKYCDEV